MLTTSTPILNSPPVSYRSVWITPEILCLAPNPSLFHPHPCLGDLKKKGWGEILPIAKNPLPPQQPQTHQVLWVWKLTFFFFFLNKTNLQGFEVTGIHLSQPPPQATVFSTELRLRKRQQVPAEQGRSLRYQAQPLLPDQYHQLRPGFPPNMSGRAAEKDVPLIKRYQHISYTNYNVS